MYLFFDVETVGFPKKWNRPHTDTFNWPRMVSIAFQRYGERRQHLESYEAIIQPEGFEIPIEAEQIHGISTEKAKEDGVPIEDALRAFAAAIDKADYIIAHNMNFDANVAGAEFYRKSISHRLFDTERFCTMQEGTYFCKLPGKNGRYKWPTLTELYVKLYGNKFRGAHQAAIDTKATALCFFKLIDLEAIDIF